MLLTYYKIFMNYLIVLKIFCQYWGILGPFLCQILGVSWKMVTNFRSIWTRSSWGHGRGFRASLCWRFAKPNPFLCREFVEERTFAGHFWELRSFELSVVSFVGLLISGRTRPYHFCNLLALLWCTYWALSINKKASPTETKARRRRRDCRTSLSHWCYDLLLFYASFQLYTCLYGCDNFSYLPPLSLSFLIG